MAEAAFEGLAVSANGRLLDCNSALLDMTGFSWEQLIGMPVADLVAPECRAEVSRRIAEGDTDPYEHRILKADGGTITVEVQPRTATWRGQAVRMTAIRDVSARKRAEAEMRDTAERYRSIVDHSPSCIHELDLEGRFLSINPAGLKMVAAESDEEIIGTFYLDCICSADRPELQQLLDRAFAGETSNFEFSGRGALEGRILQSCFIPIPDRDGKPARIMGITNDITERKQAEQQLLAALNEIRDLKEQLEAENIALRKEIGSPKGSEKMIAGSAAMVSVLNQARAVAGTDSTVLILGETGVGKELLAQEIHKMSPRRDQPLVTINCAAIPATLVEGELFGREKGAYTGADSAQAGRFERADGGTLFLDEIGELPEAIQAKLLRVLQEGQVERLGGTASIKVDVRVIAATNRDLIQAVNKGEFRNDLYFRLSVFPITLPPLRDRPEDIPDFARRFVEELSPNVGKQFSRISARSLEALRRYGWPGNIRELRNTIERAMIQSSGGELEIEAPSGTLASAASNGETLAEVEKNHIIAILNRVRWKVRGPGGAAEILDLPPTTLESKMKKLGIRRPS